MSLIFRRGLPVMTLLLTHAFSAIGLNNDKDKPVQLSSNVAIRNEAAGFTEYSGDVILKQGSLTIEADSLTVFHSSGHAKKIVASGNPVKLRQQASIDKDIITAEAKEMTYKRDVNVIILKKSAKIDRENSSVRGDKITYSISEQRVVAESNNTKETGRVNVIIPNELIGLD